jgi:hypothetical protein
MNVDDVESVTTELDHGLEIMRQFNLKYIVQMCSPQLLQLRRECGFKIIKMRKPDLMESMILQLYAQTPIQTTAPKHVDAKGHIHEPLQTRAGNAFSDLTSMKDATKNVDKYQKSDRVNTHGMNGDFMNVTQHNHCSKSEVDNPSSLAPLPRSVNKFVSCGDLLNETDLHRSHPPYTKSECIQGWCGTSELRKQDISILGPNNADLSAVTGPDLDLGLKLLSSQPIGSREILQEDH